MFCHSKFSLYVVPFSRLVPLMCVCCDYSPQQQPVEIRRSCVYQEGPNVTNRFGIAAICSIRPAFSLFPRPFVCVRKEFGGQSTLGARERALSGAVL